MSQETVDLDLEKSSDRPVQSLTWFQTWKLALTRPSVATFERIIRDPQANPRLAYVWLFVSFIVGGLISILISDLIGAINTGVNSITCGPLISAIVSLLSLVLVTWVIQSIAGRLFGGIGTYASMIYAIAAFSAPLFIIHSLVLGIPFVNCLDVPLSIYELALSVIALKAVNKIGWGQAMVSYIGGLVLVIGIVAVFTVCSLIILGPAVSEELQNIITGAGGIVP